MVEQLRCYVWVHDHLSGIQKAVQSTHAVAEMMSVNSDDDLVKKWSEHDRTLILLSGGASGEMNQLAKYLQTNKELAFPFGIFYEDEDTLGGILTAVAMVVPKEVSDQAMAKTSWSSFFRFQIPSPFKEYLQRPLLRI